MTALRSEGIDATSVAFDANQPGSYRAVYDYLTQRHGKLDILINNAAVLKEPLIGADASSVSAEVLRETFEINFFAVVSLTQVLLPLIRKSPAGRIVNLSSVVGSLTLHSAAPSPVAATKALAYNASKAALNAFTIHLADELRGTAIKVNSAHPGWIKTELGGPYAPGDVASSWQTSVRLALLDANGPSGGFFHLADSLPW